VLQTIKNMFNFYDKSYFVKPHYHCRTLLDYFPDPISKIMYPPDIYKLLDFLAEKFECEYIIDIGCGSAQKLIELYPKFKVIGIDCGLNVNEYQSKYTCGKWLDHNLDDKLNIDIPEEILKKSSIIMSNLIEHLVSPKHILVKLKKWMDLCPVCLISTPERDLVRGKDDFGPPTNPAHVREWNSFEMEKLLKHYGFNIAFLGLTVSDDKDLEKKTILAIINKNNNKNNSNKIYSNSNIDNFKVVAIMTAYNEEDIIRNSIMKLYQQGIGVYVIDNWSVDSTGDIIDSLNKKGFLIGCEKFPPSGPSEYYEWNQLLSRIEDLTRELDANWFIHHDVDEIRESPWKGMSLKKGIYIADLNGYNAIDHMVIDFKPTNSGFAESMNPEEYFKYFELSKLPGIFCQIKAWKNLNIPVSLAASGGHDVSFKDRKVYPYKFLIKHYPIRSQTHGEKKVFRDRQPRWNPEERKMGWHVHYDNYNQNMKGFIKNKCDLINYDEDFYKNYLVERISGIGIVRK
jgi:hypothetical protein